ncbi:MAG TPA: sigma-54 dependent transcriptional regulator [candidate division Zixibacteria bacterium]|nr:sigma-54-dependent Fis family transcriptional regulator [candidate division Zixibacteria bacterium]HOE28041.1 sigma-54 dependent transcriptional regulator [bacterium]MDD4916214.1 sigma-54 dependent transcriptional regulator [candidate division Zixibacteria bacterium]MDM7972734.1 sigma-54 dependent transcriptional regulator [candidate division Zixibacteria bacterium]HPI31963.1 sigma-54 dependent transcriptional regulator [candidate division Zixibacteria bacterium]
MGGERAAILVVDDAPDTLEVVRRNLTAKGYRVYTAPDVGAATALLESTPVDLVITDLKMPRASGLDLVRHVRENLRDTEVMMMTGFASVTGAIEAMKTGAEEYLVKPFTDEELFAAVKRSLGKLSTRRTAETPAAALEYAQFGILGDSPALRGVFRAIEKAAGTSATVLISGESGTGKELVARAIHYRSPRASAPFVPVNCGGIPEGLLESELFGYVKGAFTGANESRAGFFQTADGGTIFLDEIAETSLAMQVKLLRVLQDGEVYMVGATRSRRVDVRIVAATNKDLEVLVGKDLFREDLFFRLSVITIAVPPLRERGDDVLVLARHFAEKFAGEQGRTTPRLSDGAIEVFRTYNWPGNVRELENVVRRLVVMSDRDVVDIPDLPALMRYSAPKEGGVARRLAEVEGEYIRNVLARVGGNKTKAAEILGIDRKTLREKLKRG